MRGGAYFRKEGTPRKREKRKKRGDDLALQLTHSSSSSSNTAGIASAQVAESKCILDCKGVNNETLTYCTDPEAGIVNYTSCLSPRDQVGLTTAALHDGSMADERASNNSVTMPRYSEDISCIRAQKRLLCALLFPKCDATLTTAKISQPMCRSICENFFKSCNVALSTQCRFTEGTSPSPLCTGNVGSVTGPALMLMAMMAVIFTLF